MADAILSDGREITFDLRKVTYSEYNAMFDENSDFAKDEAVVARAAGITVNELHEMNLYDVKLLWREFYTACRSPLRDREDPKA